MTDTVHTLVVTLELSALPRFGRVPDGHYWKITEEKVPQSQVCALKQQV